MVTWIAFVASKIDCSVDKNWVVCIYLDNAVVVTFVPVISGPRPSSNVLNFETFVVGKIDVQASAFLSSVDCCPEHFAEEIVGNGKLCFKALKSFD